MTRFARAEGSKGSNKRKVEEATPWLEMKAQSISIKKKQKAESTKLSKETRKIGTNFKINSKQSTKKNLKVTSDIKLETQEKLNKSDSDPHVTEVSSLENNKLIVVKKSKARIKKLRKAEKDSLNYKGDENNISEKNKRSKIEKGMDYIIEDGKKYKILKNGRKKPWFDLPYQENEVMTRYKNFYIKREMVQILDNLKKSLEDKGVESKKIYTTILHEERKAHTKLRVELIREQIKTVKKETGELEKKKIEENKKVKENKKNKLKKKKVEKKSEVIESEDIEGSLKKGESKDGYQDFVSDSQVPKKKQYKLEESELMTKFEDYWVLRNKVKKLKFVREAKLRRIIESRAEPNESTLLTPEEELVFRRLMKKEKRREHSILLARIDRLGYEVVDDAEDNTGEDKVKFMGFWVKKSAAVRLDELRENLEKGGASQTEVFDAIKTERRKEERSLKNENKVYCFNCRQPGHVISDCPKEKTIGHCFTCGSTEHMARHCPEKTFGGPRFSHATCFVCGKIGHIASGCNDNPKGIYPNGGCCNECGSVRHLRANCPELQEKSNEHTIDLHARVISSSEGIEDLGEDGAETKSIKSKHSNKRIVFED